MTLSMREAIEAFKDKYAAGLEIRPEDVLTVDAMDEMIHQARAELGAWTMRVSIDKAVQDGLAGDRSCSCGGQLKLHHRPGLKVRSVQGEHETRGVSYRCDQCGRTLRPVHEQLCIESYRVTTRLLDELSSDFFLDRGAPTAVQRMVRHHGIEPGRTTVLSHAERRGQQAREFLDDKLRQATVAAGQRCGSKAQVDRVFVQVDSSSGKRVQPLKRPEAVGDEIERTPIRGLPKVERPIEGKQVKLLCAQAKGELQWAYDAYIGEYDAAPDKLVGLAATRGWQGGVPVVMTADGDEKIREAGEGAFNPDFNFVLDREHAIKHLRDVPTYGKDAIAESPDAWVAAAKDLLHSGQVRDVIQQVRSIAAQVDDEKDLNKVENVATYLQERASAVHYDYFKEQGWPQGSGAVEGGHIHIIHPNSKRKAGWLAANLNSTIALACVRASGWWDEFWQSVGSPPGSQVQAVALN